MIIFIHGFGSNGLGSKACQLRAYCALNKIPFLAPSLSTIPVLAISTLEELIEQCLNFQPIRLIGSSLGGYYALYLAQKYQLSAVLINPSMEPEVTLQRHRGKACNYFDGSGYEWTAEHLASLKHYRTDSTGKNTLLLVQTGDEVLDYQVAVNRLPDAETIVVPGGNHGFEGFDSYLEKTMTFLQIK
ncbi:YqiA/YcfP family alpha/beta fold hydrolase [Alkalimonas sp. MEB108]|uniref:YqiA/YcfP family alpha/beta fold hydrolase n=1 Tax=Alkalimonas cellulosilytica TaxID=3058395 RepID=A0ABU7J9E0_9GAMM|nr:YqiA/YcfP family alpha/beta fold hydrolase [Alkalimonas sp. MEB108]MEE2003158.1 YqiA/YcfP family alpha/beta fold hydrolase [Alkalimonas sp. MEB108]